jgi:hypothetical protein
MSHLHTEPFDPQGHHLPPDLTLAPPLRGISLVNNGPGVEGTNTADGDGVLGDTSNLANGAAGAGVRGVANTGRGVAGFSQSYQGVYGHSVSQAGVVGESDEFDGVFGTSHSPNHAGVSGHNPGGLAGYFDGNVTVTANVTVTGNIDVTGEGSDIRLTNGDCAEDFDIGGACKAEPGSVMIVTDDGSLSPCHREYDKRVAGVISGAGDYKPGIILDAHRTSRDRQPVALMGKVFCKVDAQFGAIAVGDLLTTSPTPGHAMAVSEPARALGTVIGKALRALPSGQGLLPILVALQ